MLARVAGVADLDALERIRVGELGKKGRITLLMKDLAGLDADTRRARGAALNVLKTEVAAAIDARKAVLAHAELDARLASERMDITLPVRPGRGRVHPISQTIDEVVAIFGEMGFAVAEGRTSRTTGPTSARSTSRPSIRPGRRWTPFARGARRPPAGAAPTPRRCRYGRCWRSSRRSASSRRAAPTDRTTTQRTRRCSIRSRAW